MPNLDAFLPVQVIVAGKSFTYKYLLPEGDVINPTLSPRDAVVVDFGSKGLTVGIVESINQVPIDPNAKFQYKWIVQPVDRSAYDAILAAESGRTSVMGARPSMADMLKASSNQ